MSTTEILEGLQRRIEELERKLAKYEAEPILKCSELHIVDSTGNPVITLSVNEDGFGEILVESVNGISGVHIRGEALNGGGSLEVFKKFAETLEPWIVPRKDSVLLVIEKEELGGGGEVRTLRNHAESVSLGSHYGYGGVVSVNGEHDRECHAGGRVLIGVDRETDQGVILLRTVGDPEGDPDHWMKTVTKLGNGNPPEYRAHETNEEGSQNKGDIS